MISLELGVGFLGFLIFQHETPYPHETVRSFRFYRSF